MPVDSMRPRFAPISHTPREFDKGGRTRSHRRMAALLLLAGLAFSEFAWADTDDPRFRQLDTDNDGFISLTEAAKDKALADVFAQFDANKDERLDRLEFAAAEQAQQDDQNKKEPLPPKNQR